MAPLDHLKARARRGISRSIRRAKVNPRVRALITGATSRSGLSPLDTFVSSDGHEFQRLDAYRDAIVPRWRGMLDPLPAEFAIDRSVVAASAASVELLRQVVEAHGGMFGDVLDVGCDIGLHVHALVAAGARTVHGIDIPEYGANALDVVSVERQSQLLVQRRRAVAEATGVDPGRARFDDRDVTALEVEEAYDLVISWETMEHIHSPARALERMYAALRPGGLSLHEYNPFFAIDGGHSLCTLDFDWGHARLRERDVETYLRRYRPGEADAAMTFYRSSLNRLTLAELREAVEAAGFEVLMLLPWAEREEVRRVDSSVLEEVQAIYPRAQMVDLVSPRVWLLLRRPLT